MYGIGALSRRTGVKVPTIRYYEQTGLLAPPERTEGNQRRFSEQEAERLAFIKHARDLGFSLDAIRDLIELSDHPERPCAHASQIAREQLMQVRKRIEKLKRLEVELDRISTGCDDASTGDCYVLKALSDHRLCAAEH